MLSNFFLLIFILTSSCTFTAHSYNNKCLRHQEILLFQLKQELIFNSSLSTKLVQWNESVECCLWHGVECDASGYVASLQLNDEAISGGIGDSSSLFRFKYLQKLNLAYNDFNYTDPIPRGIGNLTCLTHLNLSNADFYWVVPSEISSLTRLVSLDMSSDFLSDHSLDLPNLEMLLQNLTELLELYLDGADITSLQERKNWGHIISSHLPNLTSLSMAGCSLDGPLPKSFLQLHSISILRLDDNDLTAVSLQDLFTNFPSLATLTLSSCSLNGSIQSTFANLTKLIHVDLSYNSFTGSLPSTMFEGLSNLVHLNLYKNSFFGNIPQSLFALPSLLELELSYNQFNGTFQLDNFQSLPNLTLLGLSSNSLSVDVGNVNSSSYGGLKLKVVYLNSCNLSSFPDFIKHLDLEELELSNNSIVGEVPSWVWGKRLWYLDLSFNLLTNLQKPYHIPASLRYLLLASNQLKGELQMSIPLQSELSQLSVANNSFSGSIPISLCNAAHLDFLDMSKNKLSGSIPPCLPKNISVLDLSRNNISGSIPLFSFENIGFLDLSQNNISGNIPDTFPMVCGLSYLDLNNNALEGKIPKSLESCMVLEYMNVGNNMINDTFPCIITSGLIALVLHSNRFHGDLRCQGNWLNLKILDVSSNHFSGSLESIDFSSLMAMVRSSGVDFEGDFGHKFDVALIIKGKMMEFHKIWSDFSTIDLSSNSFYGNIPNAIVDLNSLHQLNFSHNAFDGSIPKSFGRLSNLESLDLSVNQLAGPIPEELGGLTFLSFLNLSCNKFVGAIPKGRQIQTFTADSFEGNSGLCGFPLSINCSNTNVPPVPGYDETGEEKKEIEWENVCAAVGYVVGVGSFVWLLLFCRSFREKYFGKIEEVVEDMFIARDMRRRRARRAAASVRNRARRQ